MSEKPRILLTGGTGFVGRHVVRLLQSADVDVLLLVRDANRLDPSVRAGLNVVIADLNDPDSYRGAIREFSPETCVHMAWEGIPDYSFDMSMKNLNCSLRLLNTVLDDTPCRRVISCGSCFEYGRTNGECREGDACEIQSFFSWAKHSLRGFLEATCHMKDVSFTWFRFFYVYGPGQRSGALIPSIIAALQEGRAPDIRSPRNANDFVYVGDVARAICLALASVAPSGIYNLGTGTSHTVTEICEVAEELLTGQKKFSRELVAGEDGRTVDFWADVTKTAQHMEWKTSTSLREGIKSYIESARKKT